MVFQIGNCNELVIGFVACLKAGLIPVCTLAAHREQEIGYLGRHAGARLHFVQGDDPKFDDVAFAARMRAEHSQRCDGSCRRAARRGARACRLRELIESDATGAGAPHCCPQCRSDPFQVAVFQLSGGTTGMPKIIPRFHNEYIYNMRAVAAVRRLPADDCLFMPMPMMHNLNMGCCFGPFLLTGGTVAVASGLTPEALGDVFRQLRADLDRDGGADRREAPARHRVRRAAAAAAARRDQRQQCPGAARAARTRRCATSSA